MYKPNFCIDTSNWEGMYSIENLYPFPKMVILKATEGTGYIDPTFSPLWLQARKIGIPRGAYHFIRPGNIRNQAEHFVATILKADPELQKGENGLCDTLWLDWEVGGIGQMEIRTWLLIVEEKTGIKPGIYTRRDIWRSAFPTTPLWATEYDFWLAWYPLQPEKIDMPPDFVLIPSIPREKHVLWQYGQGAVVGVAGACDFDTILSPAFAERIGCRDIERQEVSRYYGVVGQYGARVRTLNTPNAMLIAELKSGEKVEGSEIVKDDLGNTWIRLSKPVVGYSALRYNGKEIIKIEQDTGETGNDKGKEERRIKRVIVEYDDGNVTIVT